MNVYPLFQHDSTGLAIPSINPLSKWVLESMGSSALVTIKLDGIQVKVDKGHLKRIWVNSIDNNIKSFVSCDANFPEDRPLLTAYANGLKSSGKAVLPDGIYEAFGPGIKGNPMGCEEPYLMAISPMTSSSLIVQRAYTKLKIGYGVSEKDCYDSFMAELSESPEIEGFVLLYEQTMTNPLHWASICRAEFGLPWPVKALVTA